MRSIESQTGHSFLIHKTDKSLQDDITDSLQYFCLCNFIENQYKGQKRDRNEK